MLIIMMVDVVVINGGRFCSDVSVMIKKLFSGLHSSGKSVLRLVFRLKMVVLMIMLKVMMVTLDS